MGRVGPDDGVDMGRVQMTGWTWDERVPMLDGGGGGGGCASGGEGDDGSE